MKIKQLGMAVLLIALMGACGEPTEPDAPDTAPKESKALTLLQPQDGAAVKGNVVRLYVDVVGLEIVKADGDSTGKTGHFHVFIDREPVDVGEVIPKEAGIVHSTENPILITGVSKGKHKFTVVVGDGTHKRIALPNDKDPAVSVELDVEGPSVDASAPTELTSGQDLTIEVKVDGVTLVGADKDQGLAGTTGHLHVLVDPESPPEPGGEAIPKDDKHIHTTETSIKIPASLLTPGEHTIWVVLGDKTHVPFTPMVADRITITVK